MFVATHDTQKVQFVMDQIECCDASRYDNFVIDFDEPKYETTIHYTQYVKNKECQTAVERLCQFNVGVMEANDFACHQMN